jgi:hypothetical protein
VKATPEFVGGTIDEAFDVREARLVVIHDMWVGYSASAPIAALYELRLDQRGALVGEGRLSTALSGERTVDVAVSPTSTRRFLDAVARAETNPGPYEPFKDHTDDYPCIELTFACGSGGLALLFTKSQGKFNAPWGACIGGELFTLPGEEVGRALRALRRPLHGAVLDRMIRDPHPAVR